MTNTNIPSKKRILFICNTMPAVAQSVGSILYGEIINAYGADNFFVISTDRAKKNTGKIAWQSLNLDLKNSFKSKIGIVIGKGMSSCLYLLIWVKWLFVRKQVIKEIVIFNPETILITLRGNLLLIIRDLIEKSEFKGNIVLYDSDTIEPERIRGNFIFKKIKTNYNWLLEQCNSILVAGEGMKKEYSKFKKPTIEILRVPFENRVVKINDDLQRKRKLTVFFAGTMYAKEAFYVFIKNLEIVAKNTNNIEFKVIVATLEKLNLPKVSFKIKQTGWLSEDKLRKYTDISDFAYVPYSFRKKKEHQMTFAFPTKIGYYVSNGLPVFFHGPSYSAVSEFVETNKIGINCLSLDDENVVNAIKQMIDIIQFKSDDIAKNLVSTHINEFSYEIFKKKLTSVL